ncbi:hypothetical protein [Nocardioides yefusunii]|uniref:Flagellar protein FliT n=1 Tax=Nocardioides yefusunii TaxID=2500546 RepID=A0ABW1QZT7_9ACTN|nr:hypothetical protein [Nocardioides yefusunii]
MTRDPWRTELGRLEQHVDEAENLLATALAGTSDDVDDVVEQYLALPQWSPASGIGRMPQELVAPAEELLARQRDLASRIEVFMRGVKRQRSIADRIHGATTARPRSVYLDVQA